MVEHGLTNHVCGQWLASTYSKSFIYGGITGGARMERKNINPLVQGDGSGARKLFDSTSFNAFQI